MSRYKVTFRIKFSFGFDALDKFSADAQVETIKKSILEGFKKEYGENVVVLTKVEKLPF